MRSFPILAWTELFKSHHAITTAVKVDDRGVATIAKPSWAWRTFCSAMKMAGAIVTYGSYIVGAVVGVTTGSALLGVGSWVVGQLLGDALTQAPDRIAKATGIFALAWMYAGGTDDHGNLKAAKTLDAIRPWATRFLMAEGGVAPEKSAPNWTQRMKTAEDDGTEEEEEKAPAPEVKEAQEG